MNTIDFEHPSDDFVQSIDVHTLLPQAEPFVMIGSLEHFDRVVTRSKLVIPSTNIFVSDGIFSSSGLIENIAQTCAARIGYINKYILKKEIQLGFIGAIKDLEIFRLPQVGETLHTTVNVIEEIFGMILVRTEIVSDEETLVQAEMKIAIKNEDIKSN